MLFTTNMIIDTNAIIKWQLYKTCISSLFASDTSIRCTFHTPACQWKCFYIIHLMFTKIDLSFYLQSLLSIHFFKQSYWKSWKLWICRWRKSIPATNERGCYAIWLFCINYQCTLLSLYSTGSFLYNKLLFIIAYCLPCDIVGLCLCHSKHGYSLSLSL